MRVRRSHRGGVERHFRTLTFSHGAALFTVLTNQPAQIIDVPCRRPKGYWIIHGFGGQEAHDTSATGVYVIHR